MIDDQKVVFETARWNSRAGATYTGEKHVMIVRGGPGTGKSVVAVNLLVRLTARGHVGPVRLEEQRPRNVYSKLLRRGEPLQGLHRQPVPGTGQVPRA